MDEFDGSPKTWPPLGMPTGSVRALLALLLVSVVVIRIVRGDDLTQADDMLWIETLLIALAHYFTTRRFVELPPDVLRRLEDEGVLERERHPLYLPRNSIRIFIVGAFAWLTYYLYINNRLLEHHAASLLALMGAFSLGALMRRISRWWNKGRAPTSAGTWGDLKALIVLIAMLIVAFPVYLNSPPVMSPMLQRATLGLMLFYFGSR